MAIEQEMLSGIHKESPNVYSSPLADEKLAYDPEFLSGDGNFAHIDAKRVLRKMDLHLIPMLALLYLLAFLDRGNIGNARIEGLDKDLKLTGGQYNWTCKPYGISFCASEMAAYIEQ